MMMMMISSIMSAYNNRKGFNAVDDRKQKKLRSGVCGLSGPFEAAESFRLGTREWAKVWPAGTNTFRAG